MMFGARGVNRVLRYTAVVGLLFLSSSADCETNKSDELTALRQRIAELKQSGKFADAIPLAQQALTIAEAQSGPEDLETARSLNDLGELYSNTGDLAKSEPLLQRALKIREEKNGSEHPDTAQTLEDLAIMYESKGDFVKAESLIQSALKIRGKALGNQHADTATSWDDLGNLYYAMGDFSKAESALLRAVQIREKALGLEHPDTGASLANLGAVYIETGDYAKAELYLQRALAVQEKTLGPEHTQIASTVNSLAVLYYQMGDYNKAEPLYRRALEINEKINGPENPETATNLNNLAGLYQDTGDYRKAEQLYERALRIREKALGAEHELTAASLGNLATLYRDMGNYDKAEPLLQRSIAIDDRVLGPENAVTAIRLTALGRLYRMAGDYAKANPPSQRGVEIFEKVLGSEHPYTGTALQNLAFLKIVEDKRSDAEALAIRSAAADEHRLANILSFTSEDQRLAFQKTADPYSIPATLGAAPLLAQSVLRNKGVVLDSLLEDRLVAEASRDPQQREAVAKIKRSKQRLMQLQLEIPSDTSETAIKRRDAEKEKLSKEVQEMEASLARQVIGLGRARRALSVTVTDVQNALAKDAVLLELLRYNHYLGKNQLEPRYGAVLIARTSEAKWVSLGSAAEIEKNIELYQKSARGRTDETTLSNVLRGLHGQIWAPVDKALPLRTKTVILSLDGQLSFVSFATLLGPDDKFVSEKFSIRYVASGRDLLRQAETSSNPQTFVYANPDFGGKAVSQTPASGSGDTIAFRSVEMRDLEHLSLPPLPGTAAEANALQKRGGKSVTVFLGAKASERELRQSSAPHILHLATHGFFLPEIELAKSNDALQSGQEIPKGKLVNPMHRSGLALAGARATLQAWGRGEVPPTEDDGIVTAAEVGGLKLDGTWLVVLSACDTGSGEARAGEGVMGLRRGFIQAGAQNLLMTLWPISDQTTVNIMLDFYDAALKSGNAPQALTDTQRYWLVKLRKERGLLDAVRLAGPFIMSSQGKP